MARDAVDDLDRVVLVGVTDDDEVDLGNGLGQDGGIVLRQTLVDRGGLVLRQSGVDEDDNDVSPFFAQCDRALRSGLDRVSDVDLASEVRLVPDHRARGGDGDDADLDLVAVDGLGEHESALGQRLAGLEVDDVGAQQWGVEVVLVAVEFLESVVELVVADVGRVITNEVECAGHDLGAAKFLGLLGREVGQRGALDGVTVVERDDGVGTLLGAELLDDGGHPTHAQRSRGPTLVRRRVGSVGEVVPVVDVTVDVGGGEHRQRCGTGSRACGGGSGRRRRRREGIPDSSHREPCPQGADQHGATRQVRTKWVVMHGWCPSNGMGKRYHPCRMK